MIIQIKYVICVFLVYVFSFNIQVLDSSLNSQHKDKRSSSCREWEFQCENGQCVPTYFGCDGILDCTDGSDETSYRCRNKICKEGEFRCQYGACMEKQYQCDGFKQCVDGSDELVQICNKTNVEPIRIKRAVNNSCRVPAQSIDRTVTFICNDDKKQSCLPVNGLVPDMTTALIKCNPGYYQQKDEDEEENVRNYICHNKWKPPITKCTKICDKLNPVNVDLQCNRNGIKIPCDGYPGLLAGTKVRPSCKPAHRYNDNTPPNYLEIACNEDGKWDNQLFSCVPECGRTYTNPKLLAKYGTTEIFGDSPWHVAIYDKNKELICGGTIISSYLVLTAAHCFQEESSSKINNQTSDFEIVAGKFSRNYNKKDNDIQKSYKIEEIRFSKKGFYGVTNNFESDIAILILQEKVNISSTVLPACIQWIGLRDGIYPAESAEGKVVGWGMNEYNKYSEVLTTVNLPFISHQRCLDIVPDDFKKFITFDKFCAGSEDGPGVLQGDSGGGLLFKQDDIYYLYGIVSLKQPTSTGIAAFTDLAEHVNWIYAVRNEVETNITRKFGTGTATTTTTPPITVPTRSREKPSQVTQPVRQPTTFSPQTPDEVPSSGTAVEIAAKNCEKYAKYRYVMKWNDVQMAGRKGFWQNTTDCVNVVTLITEGIRAQPKEYPHMALIGFGSDYNKVRWLCGGSLISERFILGAAHCGKIEDGSENNDPPKWALLGELDIHSANDDTQPTVYEIIRIHNHPNYSYPSIHNDITLYELNTTVQMTAYIRPACLYTSTSIPVNTKGSITGWGTTGTADRRSDYLLKATISVFKDRQCRALYKNLDTTLHKGSYDSNTMICAGDLIDGKDTCEGDGGGPLQMPVNKQPCMWNIFGIACFGRGVCGNKEDPSIYTKVAYYLDWIQSIVWP